MTQHSNQEHHAAGQQRRGQNCPNDQPGWMLESQQVEGRQRALCMVQFQSLLQYQSRIGISWFGMRSRQFH